MPKGSDEKGISETGNWNVAADFSKFKIMKYLYLSDQYSTIATFGYDSMLDELEGLVNMIPIAQLRLTGLRRLIDCLITLIGNSRFAIKSKELRIELDKEKENLEKLITLFPMLYETTTKVRAKSKTIMINERVFSKFMKEVERIKIWINEPLNQYHLIFVNKEEVDISEAKKSFMEQAINRG